MPAVRFKVPWHGRQPGSVDSLLAPGIMQTLVTHGRAEWVDAPSEEQSPPATKPKRAKKPKRVGERESGGEGE